MKILVLTHTFPRSDKDATAAFMKPFCDGLVESGNEVTLVTPFDNEFKRSGDPFKIKIFKYIWPNRLHLLGYSKTMEADVALKKRAFFLLPALILFETLNLYKIVAKEKPDVINVHWILPNGLPALIVSKLTGIPYIITIPGTDAYLTYRFKLFGFLAKIIAENSIGIISNSSYNLKRIINLGVNNIKSAVISYPANVSTFRPISKGLDLYRKKLGLKKVDFIILGVGRLVYKKGFRYLIEAISQVCRKENNVKLLVGGDGDLREELVNLTKSLKLEDKVIFLGNIPRDKIIYYYNLSDVLVAPSIVDNKGNVDGGPVVSLESMACGKPQILTDVLGMADFIKNGVNGYVVPEKNAKALASAILELIKSKKNRKHMGVLNRNIAVGQLTTSKIGETYTKFFKEALL